MVRKMQCGQGRRSANQIAAKARPPSETLSQINSWSSSCGASGRRTIRIERNSLIRMLHHRANSAKDHDANNPQTAAHDDWQENRKHRATGVGFVSAGQSDAV